MKEIIILLPFIVVFVLVAIYVFCIVRLMLKGIDLPNNTSNPYSEVVLDKTKIIMDALLLGIIKKHLITNSASEDESRFFHVQYKEFLSTRLMQDILDIDEETYNG